MTRGRRGRVDIAYCRLLEPACSSRKPSGWIRGGQPPDHVETIACTVVDDLGDRANRIDPSGHLTPERERDFHVATVQFTDTNSRENVVNQSGAATPLA